MPERYTQTIAELLARRGEIAAQGAASSGQIWGGVVNQLGQVGGQYLQQREAEQKQKEVETKRKAAFSAAISTWDSADPKTSMLRLAQVVGPEDAVRLATGISTLETAIQKKAKAEDLTLEEIKTGVVGAGVLLKNSPEEFAKQYPLLKENFGPSFKRYFGYEMPDEPTDEVKRGLNELAAEWGKGGGAQKAPDRYEQNGIVYERQPDGNWTAARGIPTETPKAPNLSAEEAYIAAQYGPNPTPQQLLEGRARFSAAGRAPDRVEPPAELTLNPEGVVLSSYGVKQKEEARRQARERGLPVFENATSQTKGVLLGGLATDAQRLKTLLEDEDVVAVIGPALANPIKASRRGLGALFGRNPDAQEALQLIGMLSDTELRKRSGAAAGEPEMKRILAFAVAADMPLSNLKTNLNKMLEQASRDYKALSGVSPRGVLEESATPPPPPPPGFVLNGPK